MADQAALRILCLHGYHGSASVLREQLRPLMRGLPQSIELCCVDAPALAVGDYGWWHARESVCPTGRHAPRPTEVNSVGPHPTRLVASGLLAAPTVSYLGWERTRDFIVETFARRGPFDGVLGFSQGATLASLLVGLRSPGPVPTPELPLQFGFALMVGGFASNDPAHAELYRRRSSFELPTLHIVGRSDAVVPSSASHRLALLFPNRVVLEHDGGHIIASTPEVRTRVVDFLASRLKGDP